MLKQNSQLLSEFEPIQTFVLAQALPLQVTETVTLDRLFQPSFSLVGRVLAESIVAPFNLPSWPQSAMDGYAFSSQACQPDSVFDGQFLPVVATCYAGDCPSQYPVSVHQAVRIMTGASLPDGLDTVIPFEEAMVQTTETGEHLLFPSQLTVGRHVKSVGSDLSQGACLLEKGHLLQTKDIGLLASIGQTEIKVFRKVRVAILASGDELLNAGDPYQLGKTYDANSAQIQALCAELPVEWVASMRVKDELPAITEGVSALVNQADLVLTLGGASVGQKDFIQQALSECETSWHWKLNMKPAKPLSMAQQGATAILALPGNPLAAFMSFQLFAKPFIQKLSGQTRLAALQPQHLPLNSSMSFKSDKLVWIQAKRTQAGVEVLPNHSASQLSQLTQATGFVCLPACAEGKVFYAGESVDYWPYTTGEC